MQVDEHGEVTGWQAVAVPARRHGPATAKDVDQRELESHVRRRHADEHGATGEVAPVERLPKCLRAPDGVDDDVSTEAIGQLADRGDRIGAAAVDRVRRTEAPGPFEFAVVDVDGDDGARTGRARTEDRGVADAAAPNDGNGLTAAYPGCVQCRSQTRHHATAEQPRHLGRDGGIDLRALAGRYEGELREGADAERRAEFRAVRQRHLLGCVMSVEAVPRLTAQAGTAATADGAPVED